MILSQSVTVVDYDVKMRSIFTIEHPDGAVPSKQMQQFCYWTEQDLAFLSGHSNGIIFGIIRGWTCGFCSVDDESEAFAGICVINWNYSGSRAVCKCQGKKISFIL
jgi:hypothetical protein